MGLLEGNMYSKIAVLCFGVGLILHIISFAAPYWAVTNNEFVKRSDNFGLWRYCSNPIKGNTDCTDFIDYTTSDWLKCCQAFMTLAMFGLLGCIAVSAMYSFAPGYDGETKILVGAIAISGLTTIFMTIVIGTFGARYSEQFPDQDETLDEYASKLGWAFGVGAASLCLTFAGTGLLVIEMLIGEEM